MSRSMTRRSIAIDGKVTSIKLEGVFWQYIDQMAESADITWAQLVRHFLRDAPSDINRAALIRERVLQQASHSDAGIRQSSSFTSWQLRSGETAYRCISNRPVVVIGREESCDIVLDDPECSRRHAAAFQVAGRWWIADLDSKNGIWIGRRRVKCEQYQPQAWMIVGNHRLRILDSPPVRGSTDA